jgi:hypothetical protein
VRCVPGEEYATNPPTLGYQRVKPIDLRADDPRHGSRRKVGGEKAVDEARFACRRGILIGKQQELIAAAPVSARHDHRGATRIA